MGPTAPNRLDQDDLTISKIEDVKRQIREEIEKDLWVKSRRAALFSGTGTGSGSMVSTLQNQRAWMLPQDYVRDPRVAPSPEPIDVLPRESSPPGPRKIKRLD